jgi:RNA polymerase sigma-70 factor (ECF subfamily)
MDPGDFHALYERHARDVFRFALYLCGDRSRAEDVAAETFAVAWTAADEARTSTMKAYLYTIARNLVRQRFRRDGPRAEIDPELADPRPGPASVAEDRMELRAVLTALQRLPESDRAALLMRAQDGLSHEEIARALGLSIVAVRVKIHRARLVLHEWKIRQERRP